MKATNYIAELIFRIDNKSNPPLSRFEKQIRLLQAENERDAYLQVLIAATKELDRHSDTSQYQWEFAGIGILHPADQPEAVIEVDPAFEHPQNPAEFMRFLRERNASLQSKLALSA